jgi:Ring finger domain
MSTKEGSLKRMAISNNNLSLESPVKRMKSITTKNQPVDEFSTNIDENNCSICLLEVEEKVFTDRCIHSFCRNCLVQWSKIKKECPICRQKFNRIIKHINSSTMVEQNDERVQAASIPAELEKTLQKLLDNLNSSPPPTSLTFQTTIEVMEYIKSRLRWKHLSVKFPVPVEKCDPKTKITIKLIFKTQKLV